MFSNKSVFNAFAVSCHLSEAKTTLDSALRLRRPQNTPQGTRDGKKMIVSLRDAKRQRSVQRRYASETSAKVFNSSFFIRNSLVPRTGVSFVIRHWSEAPANETSAKVFHSSFACAPYRGIIRNSSFVIRHWGEATLDRQPD